VVVVKVLVAEGNEDSRNLLVKQLQGYGHEVIAVANGAEALEQALKEKPDILVTDILMPHMDGFMLCHLWKQIEQLRHIPFIFYTSSYTSDKDRQFALSLGADAFISKPTDPEKLVRVIVEAYEKAKSGLPLSPEVAPLEPSRYFTEYSKRLSTMLDKKVAQLEREVAERKRAEDTLRESEEKYRDLFEYAGDALFIMDDRFRFLECNNHTLELFGCKSREQIIGKTPDIVSPEIQPDGQISYEKARKLTLLVMEGKPQRFEWKHYRLDNKKPFWVSVSLSRIKIKDKYFMQAVVQDITERKRAEEEVATARAYLEHSLASAPDGVVLLDKDGKTSYVNATFLNCLGRSADDFIGKTILEISPPIMTPETTRAIAEKVKRRMESGEAVSGVEIELIDKDGKKIPISYSASEIRDDKGNTLGEVVFIRDITERKRAEQTIISERDRLQALMDGLATTEIGIDIVGIVYRVLFQNETLQQRFGDLTGRLCYEVYMGLKKPCDSCPMRKAIKSKQVEGSEFLGVNGRYYEVVSAPLPDPDGRVNKAIEVVTDITERKRAEEALRRSERELSEVVHGSAVPTFVINNEHTVTHWNKACENLTGVPASEMVGTKMQWSAFYHEERPIIADLMVDNAPETEIARYYGDRYVKSVLTEGAYEVEDFFPHFGEGGRWLFFTAAPLRDHEGKIFGAIETLRDITERKRAEEERESAARRAEALRDVAQAVNRSLELDELLSESLATVLHVMQTDIGGIYLLDLQSGEFTLKAHIGVSEDAIASIGLIKLKGKEVKRVLEWQEPVLTPFSLSTGANAARIAAAIKKGGMRAHITVPIWSRDVLVGALLLANRREREFRADEVELLRDIGNELAVGIENAMLLRRTKELSLTDELTGLYNRRHFYHMLEPEMYRTLRKGRSFCLVMLDLDGFKEYNDRMGHASGDSVLQSFSQTVESSLRKSDTAFRYGGDEFIIILPETDAKRARQIMDRIRARWLRLVEAQYAPLETPLGFSTGIAQFPENADTADGLVFLADSALYYAKKEGGGRDILVSSLSAIPPELLGTATLDQVYALAATVDARDPYTYGHSGRVAGIAQKIGKATGLSEKELANLYAASLLHDVGKVGVPDAILTKPGALTAEEWVAIKKHSAEGARIVGYVRGLGALVPVIMHHHEWYDGTGYPDGLKGEETPLAARIISVADAYDTMTTARPYREVVSHQEAVEELRRCSGTQFDPELVEAFCRAMNGDSGQGRKRKPASE
jgi:diguanylate cyclase (GGDEF)-like protein/PAS domain S-box-containing protein